MDGIDLDIIPKVDTIDIDLGAGPNGGKGTLTSYNTPEGNPIIQRESGGYYTYDDNGNQVSVNSPTEHGNVLNGTPAECYGLHCRDTGDLVTKLVPKSVQDRIGDKIDDLFDANDKKIFKNKTEYQASVTGTGNNYTVYQQDIDLDLKIPGKPYTNREWMKKGNTPYIQNTNGDIVQLNLHHSQQRGSGPLFEVTQPTHKNQQALHPYKNSQNPMDPVDRKGFDNVDRPNYWKDRIKEAEAREGK